jgi:hypothetical protein
MMMHSLEKTHFAALSRPVAGVIVNTIVVTLPGSPKGALENLQAIFPVLSHAVHLCTGETSRSDQLHQQMQSLCIGNHAHSSDPKDLLSNDVSQAGMSIPCHYKKNNS